MCAAPAAPGVACIEYPKESARDEASPWLCVEKAAWVGDAIIGARTPAARARFYEMLREGAGQAEEYDVERWRREAREAARGGPPPAEPAGRFRRMHRTAFLLALCAELARMAGHVKRAAEKRFQALDAAHAGRLKVQPTVRDFIAEASRAMGHSAPAALAETLVHFVQAAEAAASEAAPESVDAASVAEVSKDCFSAACAAIGLVRDYFRLNAVPPAPQPGDGDGAAAYMTALQVITARHARQLLPRWTKLVSTQPKARVLGELCKAVTSAGSGEARFSAYVGLLQGLMNATAQQFMDASLASAAHNGAGDGALSPGDVEKRLCRLEARARRAALARERERRAPPALRARRARLSWGWRGANGRRRRRPS